MKAFGIAGILLVCVGAICCVQHFQLMDAQDRIAELTRELDVAHATQRADRETFQQQIKIIREASANATAARKSLAGKAGLSDTDWLDYVLGSMWNKNTDGRGNASGVDAGTVPGTGSGKGTARGADTSPIQ